MQAGWFDPWLYEETPSLEPDPGLLSPSEECFLRQLSDITVHALGLALGAGAVGALRLGREAGSGRRSS